MRIALHAAGEIGTRAGRILLAEPSLTALGLYGQEGATEDRRTTVVRRLTGFDAFVTDADTDVRSFVAIAAEEGLHCIVTSTPRLDRRIGDRFAAAGRTLLVGASVASGIAETLAVHELARTNDDREITIAWTEPGRAERRGIAVPFPDPVGPRWARRTGRRPRRSSARRTTRMVAHLPDPWAAALVRVTGVSDGRTVDHIVGVADHRQHLEAIALAAGALTAAEGTYPPGIHRPADRAEAYLSAALEVGMGVATYTVDDERPVSPPR
jgi:hypothetical protein